MPTLETATADSSGSPSKHQLKLFGSDHPIVGMTLIPFACHLGYCILACREAEGKPKEKPALCPAALLQEVVFSLIVFCQKCFPFGIVPVLEERLATSFFLLAELLAHLFVEVELWNLFPG